MYDGVLQLPLSGGVSLVGYYADDLNLLVVVNSEYQLMNNANRASGMGWRLHMKKRRL